MNRTARAIGLAQARLRLTELVHDADEHHRDGRELTPGQLWRLAQACVDVANLTRRSWGLVDRGPIPIEARRGAGP